MVGHQNRQQASVVFGYDAAEYQSSSSIMNQFAGKNTATGSTNAKAITTDNINKQYHVQFGEKGSKRDFSIASKQLDPTGEMHKYVARYSTEDKEMLTKTSAGFGADVAPFVTSTQLATQWDKAAVAETIRLRNEIRKKTGPRPTRGMSYDDDVEYASEAKSAFENKFKGFKPSVMAESVKNGECVFCCLVDRFVTSVLLMETQPYVDTFAVACRSPRDALLRRPREARLPHVEPHR